MSTTTPHTDTSTQGLITALMQVLQQYQGPTPQGNTTAAQDCERALHVLARDPPPPAPPGRGSTRPHSSQYSAPFATDCPLMDITFPQDFVPVYAVPPPPSRPSRPRPTQHPAAPPRTTSSNPEFPKLVKTLNSGARVCLAMRNWSSTPTGISKSLHRFQDSIHPPLSCPRLTESLNRASDSYLHSITISVQEHLTIQRRELISTFHTLNKADLPLARETTSRQLVRNNSKLSPATATDMIAEFEAAAIDSDWQLVQYGRPKTTPPLCQTTTSTTHTSNRFQSLADVEPDTPSPQSVHQPTSEPRPGPSRPDTSKRPLDSPPEIPPRKPDPPISVTPPALSNLSSTPSNTVTIPATAPPKAPPMRTVSDTESESSSDESPGGLEGAPEPGTAASLNSKAQRSFQRGSLNEFPPRARRGWSLPEFKETDSTFLLTASNGVGLAQFTPEEWRTAAYRGAHLADVCRLLADSPLPDNITTLIVFVGINDRLSNKSDLIPMIQDIKARFGIQTHKRRVFIMGIPEFQDDENLGAPPQALQKGTRELNKIMAQIFSDTDWFIPIPSHFRAQRRFRNPTTDWSHFNDGSCDRLMRYVIEFVSARTLNR